MSSQPAIQNYHELLDEKARALREAGQAPDARALAKELSRAAGLERRLALQIAVDYLAGHSTDEGIAQLNRSTRRRRGWAVVFALVTLSLTAWFFARLGSIDYPWWFLALLIGLAGVNLLAWMIEPVVKLEFLDCAGCGAPRLADDKGPCAECGSRKVKLPRVSKFARWVVSVFFAGWALFFLLGALKHERPPGQRLMEALGWLVVAAMVAAGACGVRVDKLLRLFSNMEFDEDLDRLSRHPYLATRIMILIASVGAFALAVSRLLN